MLNIKSAPNALFPGFGSSLMRLLARRALDAGESSRFQGFLRLSLFHSDGVPLPTPAQVTHTVGRLRVSGLAVHSSTSKRNTRL
jgi:hypothetical protein